MAVIQFPGVNCEFETARAVRGLGLAADVVRWNVTEDLLERFAGFILPGGFSYQDRVRAGVIASRDPVVELLGEAAGRGLPVLGICNGAQILVEAGLVPGRRGGVEVALAPNRSPGRTGYYCTWTVLRCEENTSFLSKVLEAGEVFPLPIAHAEGRFLSGEDSLMPELLHGGQIPLRYCTPEGNVTADAPFCPNGSTLGAAALSNPAGNVVAMMPHPERAAYLHQVPDCAPGAWGEAKASLLEGEPSDLFRPGPGAKVLAAFCEAVREAAP